MDIGNIDHFETLKPNNKLLFIFRCSFQKGVNQYGTPDATDATCGCVCGDSAYIRKDKLDPPPETRRPVRGKPMFIKY